ncbi:MAG TPA: DVUA0089 family protein [Fimbriimonadaceae bacterium]|nr:DVUA0089 family protein [Fimbriimonadaceae bacterium]
MLSLTRFLALAALLTCATSSWAISWLEAGDAGDTLIAAQHVTDPGVTAILGSLNDNQDADIYRIYVSNGASFRAETLQDFPTLMADPTLYLFRADGTAALFATDGGVGAQALLLGHAGLAPGFYYLAISSVGNFAVNAANQQVNAINGRVFDHWSQLGTQRGSYQIMLQGVGVPAPSAALAFGAMAFARRRKRRFCSRGDRLRVARVKLAA